MERFTAQALKSKEKKKQIYEVSMQMFSDYGYDQTTIRDICKTAGITNSTFYHFFGDKMGVLVQFYYDVLSRGHKYLEPSQENLANPFQSICDFFLMTTICMEEVNRDVARTCILSLPSMIQGSYETLNWNSEILRIAAFLEAAKKHGSVSREMNCYETAEYLLVAAHGVSAYWLTLADREPYLDVAARLMPKAFLSVTDQAIRVKDD